MKMKRNRIQRDETLRARAQLDPIAVGRLVDAYNAGARFPPLVIEARTRRLVDGWHRDAAYEALGVADIEVDRRTYRNQAELFADAVRLNVAHGQPLSGYDLRNAIARLAALGYERIALGELVRIPPPKIDEITRGFGHAPTGEPIALKRGLAHLRGQQLSTGQIEAMRHYGGSAATFYARQLALLLDQDMWPRDNANFREAMDQLVELWGAHHTPAAAA
jgi:hypothetical protein